MKPQIIDKGVPTAGLIAHTLVARFVDHLPYARRTFDELAKANANPVAAQAIACIALPLAPHFRAI